MSWSWYAVGSDRLERDWIIDALDGYGSRLYVATRPYGVKGVKIWQSENGGDTWTNIYSQTEAFSGFHDMNFFSMRIDMSGIAHLGISMGGGDIWKPYYCRYNTITGEWNGPTLISDHSAGADRALIINLGVSNNLLACMGLVYDGFYYARKAGTGWVEAETIDSWYVGGPSRIVQLSNGVPVCLTNTGHPYENFLLWRKVYGTWTNTEVDTRDTHIPTRHDPKNDLVHFAYKIDRVVYYRNYDGNTISPRVLVVDCSEISGDITDVYVCDICVDDSGKLRILFRPTPYPGSYHGSLFECISVDGGQNWSDPQAVYITDGSLRAFQTARYFPGPQAGAAILTSMINASLQAHPWFGRTSDFQFMETYGPWETRLITGDDLELVVV